AANRPVGAASMPTAGQPAGGLRAVCWPHQGIQHAFSFTQRARWHVNSNSTSLLLFSKEASRNPFMTCRCSFLFLYLDVVGSFCSIFQCFFDGILQFAKPHTCCAMAW